MKKMKCSKKILAGVVAVILSSGLGACAGTGASQNAGATEPGVSDPFENVNRGVFAFNEAVDKAAIEPVARGYRYVTPKPVRTGVRNFLRNLKSPIVIGNQLLQGDMEGTMNATGRLFINTLLGIGGIFDIADMGGIPYEPEDFGQTLAVWGVGNGPYVVIPLLGPSTVRDGTGMLVDSFADPVRIYLFNTDREWLHYTRLGVSVIDQREELLDVIDDLRANSFDYYAAIRSAYFQRRNALISDMSSDGAAPDIPDYDE